MEKPMVQSSKREIKRKRSEEDKNLKLTDK
jgi:hypothetical protein